MFSCLIGSVKMRGVADGEYLHQDFFIVMDRLFGTLDQVSAIQICAGDVTSCLFGPALTLLLASKCLEETIEPKFGLLPWIWKESGRLSSSSQGKNDCSLRFGCGIHVFARK